MFFIFIKIMLLVSLIKLVSLSQKPFMCSGIYTGVMFFAGLMFGVPFGLMVINAAIAFGLSSLYFWLLYKFEDSIAIWLFILMAGIFIGLV